MTTSITATFVGGPTLHLTYAGLTFLTDPTFDPPGEYPGAGDHPAQARRAGRAARASSARSTSCCSRTTSTPTTSTTRAARCSPSVPTVLSTPDAGRADPGRARPRAVGAGDRRRGHGDRRPGAARSGGRRAAERRGDGVRARRPTGGRRSTCRATTRRSTSSTRSPGAFPGSTSPSCSSAARTSAGSATSRSRSTPHGRAPRPTCCPARAIVPVHHTDWAHFVDPLAGRRGALRGGRSARPAGRARARASRRSSEARLRRRHARGTPPAARARPRRRRAWPRSPRHPLVELERERACPWRAVARCRRSRRRRGPPRAGRWSARAPCGGPCRGPGRRGRGPAGTGRTARAAGRRGSCGGSLRARRRSASRMPAPSPSTSTGTASSGQRAFDVPHRRVEERGDLLRRQRPEQVQEAAQRGRAGPSSLSSARVEDARPGPRASAGCGGRPGERCRARARGPRAARRAGTASRTCGCAWQASHQRRYGSVISAVIRVDRLPLTIGSVDDLAHRARRPSASASTTGMPAAFSGRRRR